MLRAWLLAVIESPARWQDVAARLRPFIARRVSPAEIDDVMQDVFLRMQRGLPTLRDEERFTSWLFQIARSSAAEHLRVRGKHPFSEQDPLEEATPVEEDDHDAARALAGCISMFVAQLASPYREAITLVELEGLTAREAAEMAGISVSGMKSRVQRGREQLRALFDACCEIAIDARGKPTDFAPRGCKSCT